MKKENILQEIKKGLEDKTILDNLIKRLEQDIRDETSYKTTSKTKVNAIKRIAKKDNIRPILNGYHIADDGMYEFTDSYRAYRIKPIDMPLQSDEDIIKELDLKIKYPEIKHFFKDMFDYDEEVKIDLDDITAVYKMRNKRQDQEKTTYTLKSRSYKVNVSIEYLKDTIDIMGADTRLFLTGEKTPVQFENKDNEIAILLPFITY